MKAPTAENVTAVECWVLGDTSFPSDAICKFDGSQQCCIYGSPPSSDTYETYLAHEAGLRCVSFTFPP